MTLENHTEIIFCNDQSTDGTAEEVRRLMEKHPHRDIKLVEVPRTSRPGSAEPHLAAVAIHVSAGPAVLCDCLRGLPLAGEAARLVVVSPSLTVSITCPQNRLLNRRI